MKATVAFPGSRPNTACMNSSPGIEMPSGCESDGGVPSGTVPCVSQVKGPTFSALSSGVVATAAAKVCPAPT